MFIGADGEPALHPGAFPKHVFKKWIEENVTTPHNPAG